ncbi:hypothetical protein [Dactylosporangium sp. NPDC049140]|uniref:hypothetical protein n=1 Tax=Dactylosporangium sp. NPDC049140 TaxID=3155647 RepID=UPI0033D6FFDC
MGGDRAGDAMLVHLGGRTDRQLGPGGERAAATAIGADGRTVAGAVISGEQTRPDVWHRA